MHDEHGGKGGDEESINGEHESGWDTSGSEDARDAQDMRSDLRD